MRTIGPQPFTICKEMECTDIFTTHCTQIETINYTSLSSKISRNNVIFMYKRAHQPLTRMLFIIEVDPQNVTD